MDRRFKHRYNGLEDEAVEVIEVINHKSYKIGNKEIRVETEKAKLYKPFEGIKPEKKPLALEDQHIEVHNESTVDTIFRECNHITREYRKVGVLNFASATSPGGGFVNGCTAQEEMLCQSSNLWRQLEDFKDEYNASFREIKTMGDKAGLYNDKMYVSNTLFFRDSRLLFVEHPVMCTVVTSAAVNVTRLKGSAFDDIEKTMRRRMELILHRFIEEKCNVIILGAFGCGVFKNDQNLIANIWKDLLVAYGGYFDKVIFTVLCKGYNTENIDAFNRTFNKE